MVSIMANSTNKQAYLPAHLRNNSNVQYISELKTITPGTTAKDLTEEQKQAFVAIMRMVHDPTEKSWTQRKEKLERQKAARIEAEAKQRNEEKEKKAKAKAERRESLKLKVRKMRAERRFPLAPEGPRRNLDRRYGFIPRSQRKNTLADYAKV